MIQCILLHSAKNQNISVVLKAIIRVSERTLIKYTEKSRFFYSPTNAQVIVLKNNIKIYIKTAPTCFGAVTPSSGSALFVLAKVTVVKIVNYGTSVSD